MVVCPFVLYLLANFVWSVFLKFTDSDYPFGIFKRVLYMSCCHYILCVLYM